MSEITALEPIRLGLMPPLTGLVDIYGPEIVCAARIACEEINGRGGVLGRPLELIIEDDGSLPQTAVPAALKLIDEHRCAAIIGNLLSNSRIAVASHASEPRRIPYLNFSFYEGSIYNRYFFHFAALPNQQIDKMIPYMAEHFGPKMFFAGNNYEWPRGSIDAAKRSLQRVGGDILGEEYLDIGASTKQIDELLDLVARSGADVFVPYFAGADQITLLTRFTEMGLKSRMAVVMGHYDEMMVSRLSPQVRECFYSSNTYFMSVNSPENRQYLELLAKQPGISGIWPHGNGILTNFGEGTYLCVHAFAKAVEIAGNTDAEALVAALENIRLSGPQGDVIMDPATHHASVNTYLSRCNADGTFTIVERFGRIPPEIPERYRLDMQAEPFRKAPVTARDENGYPQDRGGAINSAAREMLSLADMAILATDEDGVILEANRSTCKLFGYIEQELLGMSVHLLLPPSFRHRHAALLRSFVLGNETERRMSQRSGIMGYRKDGTFMPLEAGIAKFHNGNRWTLVVTLLDISERKRVEEDLLWQSTHDPLTGLPNRELVHERLTSALNRSKQRGLSVALLFIDLDGFKLINDTHGHDAGNALLKIIASRLMEQAHPGDIVGRISGDEFIVLCEQIEQPTTLSTLAERINDSLRKPVEFSGMQLFVTASIGIAIGHGATHSADELLRSADTAMYAVKEKGRDGWQFFSENLQKQAQQRLVITQGLRLALKRNEFSTRFQPIVAATTGRIVGAELLLRWHPPEGEISPALFIPIAEMTGTIVPIGIWVFRQGCLAEADWRQRWGTDAPYVSINVSARHLDKEKLADDFAAILRETGAEPSRILLEITETSLMSNIENNLRILRELVGLGMRIAVDDFGTGYSSLAQLARMPVSVLKIDKAFIDGIGRQQESLALIRAVIGLGRALNLKLLAEGVENEAQLKELNEHGCDLIQGYLFHRPLDEQTFIMTADSSIQKWRSA